MAVATPPHRQSPVNEMDVDRDSAIGDTVVVKSTSSTGKDHPTHTHATLTLFRQ